MLVLYAARAHSNMIIIIIIIIIIIYIDRRIDYIDAAVL